MKSADNTFDKHRTVAAAYQRIGNNPSQAPKLGSSLPTFDASPAISQKPENVQLVLNPTLRRPQGPAESHWGIDVGCCRQEPLARAR